MFGAAQQVFAEHLCNGRQLLALGPHQVPLRIDGKTRHVQLDHGPIVIQAAVPVRSDDTPDTLAARVLTLEHRIYPQAVRWFAEGRLVKNHGRINLRDDPASQSVLSTGT